MPLGLRTRNEPSQQQICSKAIVFLYFVLPISSQQVRVGGRNKNKNKIHSDHFPNDLKLKETRIVFPSILIQLENGPNNFIFILPIN